MKLLKTMLTIAAWNAFLYLVFFGNSYLPQVIHDKWWGVPYVFTLITVIVSSLFCMAATIIHIHKQ